MINGSLKPNFWRPDLDNDVRGWLRPKHMEIWKTLPETLKLNKFSVKQVNSGLVEVSTSFDFEDKIRLILDYQISGNGQIKVSFTMDADKSLPDLAKVGMTTGVNTQLDNMSFYGKGPFENYSDREAATEVDVYSGKIQDFIHSYVKPQENGNRTDVEWLKLTNKENRGLKVTGLNPLNISVWPWSQENLEQAKFTSELKMANKTTVNIDLIQAGVGGSKPGGPKARALPAYQLKSGVYRYAFIIEGL